MNSSNILINQIIEGMSTGTWTEPREEHDEAAKQIETHLNALAASAEVTDQDWQLALGRHRLVECHDMDGDVTIAPFPETAGEWTGEFVVTFTYDTGPELDDPNYENYAEATRTITVS